MSAENYIAALEHTFQEKYGIPLHEKLGLSRERCNAWLKTLYQKNLPLQDAEQTIETVLERQAKQGEVEDIEEFLLYI